MQAQALSRSIRLPPPPVDRNWESPQSDCPWADYNEADYDEDDDAQQKALWEADGVKNDVFELEKEWETPAVIADNQSATLPSLDVIEALLEKEMKKLSLEEQERAAFHVHGLSNALGNDVPDATTTLEEERLVQLDKEMKKLKLDKTNPLLQDKSFRLMFLRCEELDAKLAAQRIQGNLEMKKKMFGEHTLRRHLEWSDLTVDDKRMFESGCWRVAPQRDVAGRIVVVHAPDAKPPGTTQLNVFRAHFYQMCCLMRSPQVQRQGLVLLIMLTRILGKTRKDFFTSMKLMKNLKVGTPRKIGALHICFDTGILNPDRNNQRVVRLFLATFQLALRPNVRAVTRTHVALRETVHFQLKSYGVIITDDYWPPVLPHQPSGTIDMHCSTTSRTDVTACPEESDSSMSLLTSNAAAAVALAQPTTKVAEPKDVNTKIIPTEHDVLLGRGSRTRDHAGNQNAVRIVNLHRKEYQIAKKAEKTVIAQRIVSIIEAQGGRFLKFDDDKKEWLPVDKKTAQYKISHLYRNLKKNFFPYMYKP